MLKFLPPCVEGSTKEQGPADVAKISQKYSTFIHIYDLRTAWRRKAICLHFMHFNFSAKPCWSHFAHNKYINIRNLAHNTIERWQFNPNSSSFLCASKLSHSFLTLVDGNCSGRSVFWETYVGSPLKSLKMFAQL